MLCRFVIASPSRSDNPHSRVIARLNQSGLIQYFHVFDNDYSFKTQIYNLIESYIETKAILVACRLSGSFSK